MSLTSLVFVMYSKWLLPFLHGCRAAWMSTQVRFFSPCHLFLVPTHLDLSPAQASQEYILEGCPHPFTQDKCFQLLNLKMSPKPGVSKPPLSPPKVAVMANIWIDTSKGVGSWVNETNEVNQTTPWWLLASHYCMPKDNNVWQFSFFPLFFSIWSSTKQPVRQEVMRTIQKACFLLYSNWMIDSTRLHNKKDELVLCVDDVFCHEKQIQFYVHSNVSHLLALLCSLELHQWVS